MLLGKYCRGSGIKPGLLLFAGLGRVGGGNPDDFRKGAGETGSCDVLNTSK